MPEYHYSLAGSHKVALLPVIIYILYGYFMDTLWQTDTQPQSNSLPQGVTAQNGIPCGVNASSGPYHGQL
jgi:hypothetical protein